MLASRISCAVESTRQRGQVHIALRWCDLTAKPCYFQARRRDQGGCGPTTRPLSLIGFLPTLTQRPFPAKCPAQSGGKVFVIRILSSICLVSGLPKLLTESFDRPIQNGWSLTKPPRIFPRAGAACELILAPHRRCHVTSIGALYSGFRCRSSLTKGRRSRRSCSLRRKRTSPGLGWTCSHSSFPWLYLPNPKASQRSLVIRTA